jgi:hypothetical protein
VLLFYWKRAEATKHVSHQRLNRERKRKTHRSLIHPLFYYFVMPYSNVWLSALLLLLSALLLHMVLDTPHVVSSYGVPLLTHH